MTGDIENKQTPNSPEEGKTRRDFLTLTASAVGAIGVGAVAIPFINSMNPAADILAQASIDVNLTEISPGTSKVVMWRGKPVFIRHRTPAEITAAQKASLRTLPDPQTDQERFSKNPAWLVVIGVCTHLGCVPNERRGLQSDGIEGGWLCACHGSVYDGSGRIVKGPAPKNLEVPPYQFINDNKVLKIG
ncbi:MAG: ubiquinol-cytochrome c reductase iron-sulfur subunit [Candidatus Paracaedibacteraceae bacterium]|nr:ubiquinol-cytochrome c reductase iron-sulfur subunit [Candidatus Paracaedibacteraceae bacterium]